MAQDNLRGGFVCVRQTVFHGIHPLRSLHSLQTLQVRSIYRNWICFHICSFHYQSITLNDYDTFFSPFIFCSEYAWILFVLSGLLQIKEQTNRSCAACLLLYERPSRWGISPSAKVISSPDCAVWAWGQAKRQDGSDIGNHSSCIFLFEGE